MNSVPSAYTALVLDDGIGKQTTRDHISTLRCANIIAAQMWIFARLSAVVRACNEGEKCVACDVENAVRHTHLYKVGDSENI